MSDNGLEVGRSPDGPGSREPSPAVSAVPASIPNAADLAAELAILITRGTSEDLTDRGRYFDEHCGDLTKCYHGDTGEYVNPADGKLVEFLWNNRNLFVKALRIASGIEARSDETRSGSAEGESPVAKPDAQGPAS